MPVTVTRPRTCDKRSTAALKLPSRSATSASRPAISVRSTRRAASMSGAPVMMSGSKASRDPPAASAHRRRRTPRRLRNAASPHDHAAKYAEASLKVNEAADTGASVREDVLDAPATEIEQRPGRQEIEAGLGEHLAPLARQHGVELRLERMEVEHVRRGVAQLLVGELGGAPIRGLLLLRELDAEQIAAQILEPMTVGEGAHQPRRDLGAVDGPRHHAEVVLQHGDVEAREMKDLQDAGVGQQRLEARRVEGSGRELHEMRDAVAGGELHQAQPVAVRVEPHGLGVDGDVGAEIEVGGQITAMKVDAQCLPGGLTWGPSPADAVGPRRSERSGAQEKTRTSTTFRPQVPETCASTNSATWASRPLLREGGPGCQSFHRRGRRKTPPSPLAAPGCLKMDPLCDAPPGRPGKLPPLGRPHPPGSALLRPPSQGFAPWP